MILKQVLPGIPKDSSNKTRYFDICLPSSFTLAAINNNNIDKKSPTISALLALPENKSMLSSTTHSQFFNSSFYLEVSTLMDGCCTTIPHGYCPITISLPEIYLPPVTPPLNWQPHVLDTANIIVPTGSLVASNRNLLMIPGQTFELTQFPPPPRKGPNFR